MSSQDSRTVAPYGLWKSPITADLLTQANISFGDVAVLPARSAKGRVRLAYIENRPYQKGRAALVCITLPSKAPGSQQPQAEVGGEDLTQGGMSAQCGVHEYGGGAFSVAPGGESFLFTQAKTCGIFESRPGAATPRRIRDDSTTSRLGDFSPHPTLPLVACVHEDHTVDTPAGVVNTIACLNTEDGNLYTLVKGPDFSVAPRFSPCGRFIAWVSWDHPSMPWWGTQLWVARFLFQEGKPPVVAEARLVAGSKMQVAQMPVWAPTDDNGDAALYFSSDETGFANLYEVRVRAEGEESLRVSERLGLLKVPEQSAFQQPAWKLNLSSFAPLSARWLACAPITRGIHSLALIDLPSRILRKLTTPFRVVEQLRAVDECTIVFVGTRHDEPAALILMDLAPALAGTGEPTWRVLKRSSEIIINGTVPRNLLSEAVPVEFPTTSPDGKPSTAHAIVFPPLNPAYVATAGAAPPAIILVHGGPTSAADAGLSLQVQFWTSRGFLVCAVNYGGSTGYGREYMERLNGQWGVVDVLDCTACAEWLASGAGAGGPASTVATAAARAARAGSEEGKAQLALISERRQPNGAIEITMRNPDAGWKLSLSDITMGSLFAGLAALASHLWSDQNSKRKASLWGLGIWGALWLWGKLTEIQQESVTSIPDLGLQLTTVRGFAIPWVHARRAKRGLPKQKLPGAKEPTTQVAHFQATALRTRLIPRDSILDVITIEAFRRWGVVDYLAISTKAAEGTEGIGRGGKLEVTFPNLLPRLPVVEHVYEKLFDRPAPKQATGWDPVAGRSEETVRPEPTPMEIANVPRVDPNKIAIAGGSSGGYTVLAALCARPTSYGAGRSSYGISELTALYNLSHKFESRYMCNLLGGSPSEVPQVYHDRSPVYNAKSIRAPVIFFQGSEDKVVPPGQSEEIVNAIKKQGGKVSYTLFEGEGHGFRQAANQKAALEGELQWYIDVFSLGGGKSG